MTDQSLLARITSNPGVLAGKPIVRGTRLSVEFLLNLLAHGATETEILSEYEGLAAEDLAACLLFASKSLANTTFMPLAEAAQCASKSSSIAPHLTPICLYDTL